MDKDGDGFLGQEEVTELVMDKLGVKNLNEDSLRDFFDHFDVNRDGKVSISEFVDVLQPELEKADKIVIQTSVDNEFIRELRAKAIEFS